MVNQTKPSIARVFIFVFECKPFTDIFYLFFYGVCYLIKKSAKKYHEIMMNVKADSNYLKVYIKGVESFLGSSLLTLTYLVNEIS